MVRMGSLRRDVLGRTACRSWSTAWSLGRTITVQPAMRDLQSARHNRPALPTGSYAMPCVSWGNTVHRVAEGGGVDGALGSHGSDHDLDPVCSSSTQHRHESAKRVYAASAAYAGGNGASQGCPQRWRGCFRRPERRGMLSAAPARSMVWPMGLGAIACAAACHVPWTLRRAGAARHRVRMVLVTADRGSTTRLINLKETSTPGREAGHPWSSTSKGRFERRCSGPAPHPCEGGCQPRCGRLHALERPSGLAGGSGGPAGQPGAGPGQ